MNSAALGRKAFHEMVNRHLLCSPGYEMRWGKSAVVTQSLANKGLEPCHMYLHHTVFLFEYYDFI